MIVFLVYGREMNCENGAISRYWRNQEQRYVGSGSLMFDLKKGKLKCPLLGFEVEIEKMEETLWEKGFKQEIIEALMDEFGLEREVEDEAVDVEKLLELVYS